MALGLLLAENWTPDRDPTGWWMSEKIDGYRAAWDGKTLRSRNGNPFSAPASFTKSLTEIPLDGELWLGRGRFDEHKTLVSSARGPLWDVASYMLIDIPMREAGPFEERLALLREMAKTFDAPIRVLTQTKCLSREHLEKTLAYVVANGGEGLMLRKPGSGYGSGRSWDMLKVKPMLDCEVTVTGYKPGNGKHKGLVGALLCVTKAGVPVDVGSGLSDDDRAAPPAVGATITVQYQSVTKKGKLRHPVFLRVRPPE
jgi:DNA ligase-1